MTVLREKLFKEAIKLKWVFPLSSVGKESTCNAENPGWIPGLGRSTGEGRGYPLQNSWASLVAQLVKNPPVMRETWVWSLGWEDLLEKGKATHSSILTLEVARSQTWLSNFHFLSSENEMIRMGPNPTWLVSLDEREVWTQAGIDRRPYEDTDRNLHIKERGLGRT